MKHLEQWGWFLVSIILNGIWFPIDLINPWDENDDDWYAKNFGLDHAFMHEEAWPKLEQSKSFHNIKKIAKDWLIIPEGSRVQGKRALRFLGFWLVTGWLAALAIWVF